MFHVCGIHAAPNLVTLQQKPIPVYKDVICTNIKYMYERQVQNSVHTEYEFVIISAATQYIVPSKELLLSSVKWKVANADYSVLMYYFEQRSMALHSVKYERPLHAYKFLMLDNAYKLNEFADLQAMYVGPEGKYMLGTATRLLGGLEGARLYRVQNNNVHLLCNSLFKPMIGTSMHMVYHGSRRELIFCGTECADTSVHDFEVKLVGPKMYKFDISLQSTTNEVPNLTHRLRLPFTSNIASTCHDTSNNMLHFLTMEGHVISLSYISLILNDAFPFVEQVAKMITSSNYSNATVNCEDGQVAVHSAFLKLFCPAIEPFISNSVVIQASCDSLRQFLSSIISGNNCHEAFLQPYLPVQYVQLVQGEIAPEEYGQWITSQMDALLSSQVQCDVTLTVQGVKIPAHKIVLATANNYFKSMFASGLQESFDNDIEIDVPSAEVLQSLIRSMYTGANLCIDESNCIDLYMSAHFMELPDMITECRQVIKNCVDEETVDAIINLELMYEDAVLQQAIVKYFHKTGLLGWLQFKINSDLYHMFIKKRPHMYDDVERVADGASFKERKLNK